MGRYKGIIQVLLFDRYTWKFFPDLHYSESLNFVAVLRGTCTILQKVDLLLSYSIKILIKAS